ncbi:Uncharacterised protein [uncultured archaeon]|nr:Uncharacterised protein [uncultured archaeon]
MGIVLMSVLALLGIVFILNANPIFTIPTWMMVSMFIGGQDVTAALPIVAVAVAASAVGRYTLARYSGHLLDRYLPDKHKTSVRFIDKFLRDEKGMIWPFSISFLYALSPLPTNALFLVAGVGRFRLMLLLSGFFMGEFLSNMAYISMVNVALSPQNCLLFGLLGLVITVAIFIIDWKKVIKSLMERERKRHALAKRRM